MGKKITDLTELTDTQSGDFVVVVDSSDNEMKKAEISKIININSGNFFDRYVSDFGISDLNTGQFSFILDTPRTISATPTASRTLTYDPVRYSVTGLPSNVEVKFLSFPVTSAVRTQGGGNSNLVFDQDIFGPEQTSGFINNPGGLDFTGESLNGAIGGDFDRDFLSNGQTGDLIEAIVRANSNLQDTPRDEIFTISHGGDCIVELKETSTSEDKTVILRQTGILAFETGLVTYQFTADHRGS
jgi:hypothetical protein